MVRRQKNGEQGGGDTDWKLSVWGEEKGEGVLPELTLPDGPECDHVRYDLRQLL